MKALVVDDDAMNRELLGRYLALLGWDADYAADGPSAVGACARRRYDLVLLDLLMPGMGGAAAARAIRGAYASDGFSPRLLAVTGSLCDGDDKAPFDAVLPKPFVLEELAAAIGAAAGP